MILYTVTVRYTEELEHIHTNKCMKIVGERERENLRLRGRGSLWKWDDDGMLGIEQGERGPLLPSLNLSNLIQRIRNVINDEGLL